MKVRICGVSERVSWKEPITNKVRTTVVVSNRPVIIVSDLTQFLNAYPDITAREISEWLQRVGVRA